MSRAPKYENLLQQAEKRIEELKKNKTLGDEIETLDSSLLGQYWESEYKRLYVSAKRQSPEIWECNAYNLPDETYYKNKDFFELLGDLININFLVGLYPQKKETLKKLFLVEDTIELMYDYIQWYLKTHDDLLEFYKLKKYADDTLKARHENIEVQQDGTIYYKTKKGETKKNEN